MSRVTCLNLKMSHVGVSSCFSSLYVAVGVWRQRMSFVAILFHVLLLSFGSCCLSEFTIVRPPIACVVNELNPGIIPGISSSAMQARPLTKS